MKGNIFKKMKIIAKKQTNKQIPFFQSFKNCIWQFL